MDPIHFLFTIDLSYHKGKPRVLDTAGRTGEYLGSGVGAVHGQELNGRVQWDLFEKVEATLCESNLRGLIETNDGATIQFDALGFFRRPTEPDDHLWANASAVTFHTDDGRYDWLNDLTATWQGTFDMEAHQHRYQVYTADDVMRDD